MNIYDLQAGSTALDQQYQADGFVQLAAFIATHSAGRAVIMVGDTNLHDDTRDPEYEVADVPIWSGFLSSAGLVDACTVVPCGVGEDDQVIDKVAFRGSTTITLVPDAVVSRFEGAKFVNPDTGKPLSDHFPLQVRFAWTLTS